MIECKNIKEPHYNSKKIFCTVKNIINLHTQCSHSYQNQVDIRVNEGHDL